MAHHATDNRLKSEQRQASRLESSPMTRYPQSSRAELAFLGGRLPLKTQLPSEDKTKCNSDIGSGTVSKLQIRDLLQKPHRSGATSFLLWFRIEKCPRKNTLKTSLPGSPP